MDDDLLDGFTPNSDGHRGGLASEIDMRLNRVRTDLEWLADSPRQNWQEANPRLVHSFARLLARVMYTVPNAEHFELKGLERIGADEGPGTYVVEVRLRTPWARRLIYRDFYIVQRKLFRWSANRRIEAYLNEFHLRAATVPDTFPLDDKLVSLLPYYTTSVRITCPVAATLLDRLCEADRHYASAMYKDKAERCERRMLESQQMLAEPLTWIKSPVNDTPTSRFPLRVAGAFVGRREAPARSPLRASDA